MLVRILGAHNFQSKHTRLVSILIDGVLCIDAGSVSTALTFEEQKQVKALLLTHRHFDHIQGVPTFAINTASAGVTGVYSIKPVLDDLAAHLTNGLIYPKFTEPASFGGPSLELRPLGPYEEREIEGYQVLATPVSHGVPAVGYQVTSRDGKRLFYTGDTNGALSEAWERVEPDLLITEDTYPNSWRGTAQHMAPADLKEALSAYLKMKGSLPKVLLVHMTPWLEEEIRREVAQVGRQLGTGITLAHEDMVVEV